MSGRAVITFLPASAARSLSAVRQIVSPSGTSKDVTGPVRWATVAQDPRAPHYSPDGHWWWDGTAWRAVEPTRPPAGMSTRAVVAVIAAGAIVVLITASVLSYVAFSRLDASVKSNSNSSANAIPCDLLEHTQVHYHAALQILDAGTPVEIPTDLGRSSACYYWLHMHTNEPDIIHVERPTTAPSRCATSSRCGRRGRARRS
jgi:hypothetical protein